MKQFIYGITIMATIGFMSLAGTLLWVFTELDALEILVLDMAITMVATFLMLVKIDELIEEIKRNEQRKR